MPPRDHAAKFQSGVSAFQSPASILVRLFGKVEVESVSGRENQCKQWHLYQAGILGCTVRGNLQVKGYGRKISQLENITYPFFSPAPWCLCISRDSLRFQAMSNYDPRWMLKIFTPYHLELHLVFTTLNPQNTASSIWIPNLKFMAVSMRDLPEGPSCASKWRQ